MHSAVQREHSRDWFHGTLLKAGTPRTNVVNLATALHREALAMELHRTPGWTSRDLQVDRPLARQHVALGSSGRRSTPTSQNPQLSSRRPGVLRRASRRRWTPAPIVLWPEDEDLYTLMCMRVESGRTAFEREKQNSPINPDLCEWPESYFDETIWFDDLAGQPGR